MPELSELKGLQGERQNEHYLETAQTARVVKLLLALLLVSIGVNVATVLQLKDEKQTATKYKGRQIFYRGLVNNHAVGGGHEIHDKMTEKNRIRITSWARRDAQRLVPIWDQRQFRVPWSEDKFSLEELACVGEGPFFDELRILLDVPAGIAHGACRAHGKRQTANVKRQTANAK